MTTVVEEQASTAPEGQMVTYTVIGYTCGTTGELTVCGVLQGAHDTVDTKGQCDDGERYRHATVIEAPDPDTAELLAKREAEQEREAD